MTLMPDGHPFSAGLVAMTVALESVFASLAAELDRITGVESDPVVLPRIYFLDHLPFLGPFN